MSELERQQAASFALCARPARRPRWAPSGDNANQVEGQHHGAHAAEHIRWHGDAYRLPHAVRIRGREDQDQARGSSMDAGSW